MMKKQQGFTLIELVAVIVILGALAVVALPRFIDLQDEAEQAAAEGVAGGLSSAFAVNYAGSIASDSSSDYVTISNGDTVSIDGSGKLDPDIMSTGGLGEYQITGDSGSGNCDVAAAGEGVTCEVAPAGSSDANFTPVDFTAIATSG